MFEIIKIFIVILGALTLSNTAFASAVSGVSECRMDVEIEFQEGDAAIGLLKNVKPSGFFPNPYCDEFKDKKIKVVASNGRAQMLMRKKIQKLSLGIERASSMGENGPVMFSVWHINKLEIGGVLVDPLEFSLFNIELLEGHEVNHQNEDSAQCHHEDKESEEHISNKIGARYNIH